MWVMNRRMRNRAAPRKTVRGVVDIEMEMGVAMLEQTLKVIVRIADFT